MPYDDLVLGTGTIDSAVTGTSPAEAALPTAGMFPPERRWPGSCPPYRYTGCLRARVVMLVPVLRGGATVELGHDTSMMTEVPLFLDYAV